MHLKVVLLEPAVDVHDRLLVNLRRIFAEAGYDADTRATASATEVDGLIENGSCDVLVSDLSLNVGIATGIGFIGLVKRRFPEIFVIACSMGDASIRMLQAQSPNFDLFFPKEQVKAPTSNELKSLSDMFGRQFRRLCGFELKRKGSRKTTAMVSGQEISEREIRALVSQVFGGLAGGPEEIAPKEVGYTILTGGALWEFGYITRNDFGPIRASAHSMCHENLA